MTRMNSITVPLERIRKMPGSFIASIGSPGAGKTTFFDQLDLPDHLRLEKDRFREAMFGTRRAYWDRPEAEKHKMVKVSMKAAMLAWPHHKVCLTDTGTEEEAILYFARAANMRFRNWWDGRLHTSKPCKGIPILLILFEQPLEVLIERNRTRPEEHRIDETLLTEKYDLIYGKEAWWRAIERRDPRESRTLLLRPEQLV
ncbi:polynucleotide kinase [Citromicrobium phage vB_CbaS-RXM]|nr:polynucleotide kinase [Citromicrobium phage vB_CbaS-RXM]